MNCHEPPCGMGREDSRPGTGHPGGHTGHPGGMPAGPRTLEDGSPLCRLIAWEVTRSCNLACKHCRAEAHPEPYPGELSTEEAKALIDTFPSVGNPIIIFTGGDPMIRPDVYELIAYAGSKGLRCVVFMPGHPGRGNLPDKTACGRHREWRRKAPRKSLRYCTWTGCCGVPKGPPGSQGWSRTVPAP